MKVKCIDNSDTNNLLTKGKIYEVKREENNFYDIKHDRGIITGWLKNRFEIVEEGKIMKAKCVDNGSYEKWLTKGNIYEVKEDDLGDGAKYFSIIDTDNGEKGVTAFQTRFEVVKDKTELKHVKKSPYINRSDLLYFTRKQLRELAKQSGVAIGRDKWDTVNNLVNSGKISLTITIESKE